MHVLVLGASGMLGRVIGDTLLDAGHEVTGVCRSGRVSPRLGDHGSVRRADLATATDAVLDDLFQGANAVVHCLGPDDREPLPAPAAATLERLLVGTTVRVAQAARRRGVRHLVVLGSYFSAFDRLHPQWRLSARHPYIRARVEQARRAEQAAPGLVTVLEIPFVFGASPGVEPALKVLFDRIRFGPVGLAIGGGGTAAVRHTDVASAVLAVVTGSVPPGRHPLAVDNITYRHLARIVLDESGRPSPILAVPRPIATAGVVGLAAAHRLRGRAMGLAPLHVARDILGRQLYLDPHTYGAPLGLVPGNVDEAIRESVRAAYPAATR
ncbi:MAG: NAD(P)-dependent oxidoreductase [Kineosporiaceae bacterium]|nr:NAD(P)-dependent oxidoreductase [Kineosporiaceae bacterium]